MLPPHIRMTLPTERTLPWWDNTKLVAINTCPTWATLRYQHKKVMTKGARAMPLEAGSACHTVFSAVRIFDLLEHGDKFYASKPDNRYSREVVLRHAERLFGVDRWKDACDIFHGPDDLRTRIVRACLLLLETCGFYDDPNDKKRTLTNLEEACIAYIDRIKLNTTIPFVYGEYVGVECLFDTMVAVAGVERRFIGKTDALVYSSNGRTLEIHENKTVSRLDDAWHAGMTMTHQITGYCLALTALARSLGYETPLIDQAIAYGLSIPLPRAADYGGFSRHPVTRYPYQFEDWFAWFDHTACEGEKWRDLPYEAPKYTHSCNRYFRPCPFVPFCHSDVDERMEMYKQMAEDEWHPLEEGNE